MQRSWRPALLFLLSGAMILWYTCGYFSIALAEKIGSEVAVSDHLQDGEGFEIPLQDLIQHGEKLFTAVWTVQEGGGRPLTKGTGSALTDPSNPLVFPRNFNRISAPDSNSCAGCHNAPFGEAKWLTNMTLQPSSDIPTPSKRSSP